MVLCVVYQRDNHIIECQKGANDICLFKGSLDVFKGANLVFNQPKQV